MRFSLKTFTHFTSSPDLSVQERPKFYRLYHVLCGALMLSSLEGCMQIDQEIERPEAMMEDSSNPNESDVDLPEEDPEGSIADVVES